MRYLVIVILFFITFSTVFAQKQTKIEDEKSIVLSGKLKDTTNGQPVSFASIVVMKTVNGTNITVGSATSTEEGQFIIQNLPKGNATLIVSYIGYKKKEQKLLLSANLDLGSIQMQQDGLQLEELSIKGEKASMEMSLEKRVFNVEKNISAVGGTAENLLRNVPSITIASDGTAQFRNKTTTIYINGKPTQLNLAQIPANQIETIEIISNPSAKYDASASSGIINLVLKKNRKPGYNGTGSVGVGNNYRFDGMINADLNVRKWNFSVLYNVNATQNPLNGFAHRKNLDLSGIPRSYFDQTTNVALTNLFQNGRLSIDYSPDKYNTFSLAGNIISGVYNSKTNQEYSNLDSLKRITSYGVRNTTPSNLLSTMGVELDWKHAFAQKSRTLSFTSGYNRNTVSNASDWLTTALDINNKSLAGYPENDKITGKTIGDQLIVQLDYTQPVNDSAKLEVGLRSFTYIRDQKYLFNKFIDSTNQFQLLSTYSQDAKITETVNAIYALYTWKMKHSISVQAGLRFEQSGLDGVSRFVPSTSFGYDFPKSNGNNLIKAFFPSFAISKKLSKSSEIGLNLSRKIERPGWRQIFIGIQSSDRQNISIGNPALQPEFVNTAELNYSKNWKKADLLSTAYFIYEDNTIKPNVQPSATDPSVFITTFSNVKADIRTGFDNTLTYAFTKNFNVVANVNLFNIVLQTDTYSRSLWTGNAKLNLTYNFPLDISAQLVNSYNGEFPQLQGYRKAIYAADFAIKKSFWKNTASITFTINDIFNSRIQVIVYDQPTAYQESMNRREVRFYKLTLQLPLGKASEFAPKRKSKKNESQIIDVGN